MGTVRFNLRKDKVLSDGSCPIDMVYQINGCRACFRTKYKVFKHNWDEYNQEVIYLNKKDAKSLMPDVSQNRQLLEIEVNEVNTGLTSLRKRVRQLENRFEEDEVCYSPKMVIEKLRAEKKSKTKIDPPSNFLFSFIDKYIQDHSKIREKGSLSVYNALKVHLQDYQRSKRVEVSFQSIDYHFFQSFQNFLIEKKGLSNTTVAKHLSTIKTFIGYARKLGVDISEHYRHFSIKKEALEVITLTQEEFDTLYNLDLSMNKKFEKVRDIFCMACSTGLRYSDLAQLKHEHIKDDQIILTTKKTKERLIIPITTYSRRILEKYKDHMYPLPRMSNQKLNDYLKGWSKRDKNGNLIKFTGICELAGINESIEIVRFKGTNREAKVYPKYELIGVHTGRKTFVTLSLEKGMTAEEVMSISGHKDYKSFKRYVNITEQRKKTVMQMAWKLNSNG